MIWLDGEKVRLKFVECNYVAEQPVNLMWTFFWNLVHKVRGLKMILQLFIRVGPGDSFTPQVLNMAAQMKQWL